MPASNFTDFLQSRRSICNARFVAARRRWPRLDAGDFSLFLRDQFSPLAAALETQDIFAVLDPAYEIGLQLVAEKLAGPSAADPAINALWLSVFPSIKKLIASSPRRVISSLSNAAHHLTATPDTRPEAWQKHLVELAPRAVNIEEFLTIAKILAWRAGLPQYRASAVAAADSLAPDLALTLLDAPDGSSWPEVRDAHLANPWFGFGMSVRKNSCIGKFRGFGGLFLTPPLVVRSGSHILVRSADEAWILVADAFGATLHRASHEEIQSAAPVSTTSNISILPKGHTPTSGVILGKTHAVTSAQSHSIWIGSVHSES